MTIVNTKRETRSRGRRRRRSRRRRRKRRRRTEIIRWSIPRERQGQGQQLWRGLHSKRGERRKGA